MNHAEAERLLERYFAGETTLAEEAALRDYYQSGTPSEEMAPFADLFAYWQRETEVKLSAQTRVRRLPALLTWIAAAAVALLIVAWPANPTAPALNDFPVAQAKPIDWSRYEVTDRDEALRIVGSALKTTSDGMHTGARITLRELGKAKEIIE